MSKTIYDVTLAELLPINMNPDVKMQCICAAFDAMSKMATDAVQSASVLTAIAGQDNTVTDLLALQENVDYYNQTLPLDIKRNLVKNAGVIHKIKGTPGAVEKVARLVFGSAQVQEWYEYGGNPYTFRVLINEFPDSENQLGEVRRAIENSKNARSWLDDVIIIASTAQATEYIYTSIEMAVFVNITQKN